MMDYREMGLCDAEYERICTILGRKPNKLELGIFAVMWSEHCSYKSSRAVLKRFIAQGKRIIAGPGGNAGVVDVGAGYAVAFKIESHNHPSAVEPFQGAATGVGGILRDIYAMGARPIALLDSLRFGPPDDPRVSYLAEGIIAGIGWYGNCTGVPTVAGETQFAEAYRGNPLVNALCVGLAKREDIFSGKFSAVGCPVMLIGSRTGRDGIHGATFASEELSDRSQEKRPSVQVGDPFTGKLLIEATLESLGSEVKAVWDLGAAGLTSAGSEMAASSGGGLEIDVDRVPLREEGMDPYEIMLSESQERMLFVVEPGCEDKVQEAARKWGLSASVVGRITKAPHLTVISGNAIQASVPIAALVDEAPLHHHLQKRPAYLSRTSSFNLDSLEEPEDLNEALLELLASPNISAKDWVYNQYDFQVQINTVVAPGGDAAVLRIKGTDLGIAITTDGNGRYCYLDPCAGGKIAVAEAARNVVCVGAEPAAITNCLNFGTPEDPEVFWQFTQVVDGMNAACQALGTPVTGGNVSFYNESTTGAIYPTPVVGMLGILNDIDRHCTLDFKNPGDIIILAGRLGYESLAGSEFLATYHKKVVGVPRIDLKREARVQALCLAGIRDGVINSAHDCSLGGLAVCVAEGALAGKTGAEIALSSDLRPDVLLFGEAESRIVVTVRPDNLEKFSRLAQDLGAPYQVIGRVGESRVSFSVNGTAMIDVELARLSESYHTRPF